MNEKTADKISKALANNDTMLSLVLQYDSIDCNKNFNDGYIMALKSIISFLDKLHTIDKDDIINYITKRLEYCYEDEEKFKNKLSEIHQKQNNLIKQ